jgi:pSer/pThr/pTyr-binding forkhead associated (FHA) protein
MQICPNCGAEQLDGMMFCSECGIDLIGKGPRNETTASLGQQARQTGDIDMPEASDASAAAPQAPQEGQGFSLTLLSSGRRLPLVVNKELLVGRLDEKRSILPDIDLSKHGGYDAGVSRKHALIALHYGGECILEDLGSANGTYVNNRRIQPNQPVTLNNGDEIKFGTLLTRVEFSDEA